MTDRDPWDAGVQNERTALAWQRTGLALFGATLVAGRLGLARWPVLTVVALTPALALSVALMYLSGRRYRQAHAAGAGAGAGPGGAGPGGAGRGGAGPGGAGPGGRLPFVTAAAVTLLGLAALLGVLAG
jgi:hypothetical protein